MTSAPSSGADAPRGHPPFTWVLVAGMAGGVAPILTDLVGDSVNVAAAGPRWWAHLGLLAALGASVALWMSWWAPPWSATGFPRAVRRLIALAPLTWITGTATIQMFSAGQLRSWSGDGLTPVILVALGTVALLWAWQRVGAWVRHPVGRWGIVGVAVALLVLDRRLLIGTHAPLHDLARFGAGWAAGWTLLHLSPPPLTASWTKAVSGGLFVATAAVGIWHVDTWLEAPEAARQVIGAQMRTGRTLERWLPFPALQEAPVRTDRLSPAAARWRAAVERARQTCARVAPKQPNVVMISVDAVRADVCGWLSATEGATPFLDTLATDAHTFTSARSPSVSSFYSIAALLSGRYPSGIEATNGRIPSTLATHLRDHGYWTAACIPPAIFTTRDASWAPVDRSLGFERTTSLGKARAAVDRLLGWVDEAGDAPFFLWAHVMDPHHPYEARERRFGRGDRARWLSEIAHVDVEMKRLVDGLTTRGRGQDTLFVFTADHGEEFMEHGFRYHGGDLYDTQCHVPLIIRVPWMAAHRRVTAAASLVALPATIADLAGVPPLLDAEAASLAPLLVGEDDGADLVAVVELPIPSQFVGLHPLRAVATTRWKMIHDLSLGVRQLFDLEADPGETRDLASDPTWRAVLDRLTARERHWRGDTALLRRRRGGSDDGPLSADLVTRARAGNKEAIAEILALLVDSDPRVRHAAADTLIDTWCQFATARFPNAARTISGVTADPYVAARLDAVDVLLGDRPVDAAFVDFLGSLAPERARAVSRAMLVGRAAMGQVTEVLTPALEAGRLDHCAVEIRALCVLLGRHDVAAPLWKALDAHGAEPIARGIILRALSSLPGSSPWARLITHVRRHALLRHALAEQLDLNNDPRHRAWALTRSSDAFSAVRNVVVNRLGHLKNNTDALDYASRAVRFDPDPQVRQTAATRLLLRHGDNTKVVADIAAAVGMHDETANDLVRLLMACDVSTDPDAHGIWRPRDSTVGQDPLELLPAGAMESPPSSMSAGWKAYVVLDAADTTVSCRFGEAKTVSAAGSGMVTIPLSAARSRRSPALTLSVTGGPAREVTVRAVLLAPALPSELHAANDGALFSSWYRQCMVKGKVTVSPDDGVAWIEDDEATFVMRTANTGPRRVTINWATVPSKDTTVWLGDRQIHTGDSGRERTYLVSPRATTPGLQEIIIKSPPKVRAGGHAPAAARAGVVAINLSES